jgi:hypothetical protein
LQHLRGVPREVSVPLLRWCEEEEQHVKRMARDPAKTTP